MPGKLLNDEMLKSDLQKHGEHSIPEPTPRGRAGEAMAPTFLLRKKKYFSYLLKCLYFLPKNVRRVFSGHVDNLILTIFPAKRNHGALAGERKEFIQFGPHFFYHGVGPGTRACMISKHTFVQYQCQKFQGIHFWRIN